MSEDSSKTKTGLSPLGGVEVSLPPNQQGKTLVATLKSKGRIIAQGRSKLVQADSAWVFLYGTEFLNLRGLEDYQLWLVIKAVDNGSWYSAFNEYFIETTWQFQQGPWKEVRDLSLWQLKKISSPDNILRIHYHRYGGYQAGIGLWIWNDYTNVDPVEIFHIGQDEFGLIFELDLASYGEPESLRLGILPRIAGDWSLKEDDNKYWDVSLGKEIYLVGTVKQIWQDKPNTSQMIFAAYLDGPTTIELDLSRPVDPGELIPEHILIVDELGNQINVSHVHAPDKPSSQLRLETATAIDAGNRTYTVSVTDFSGSAMAIARGLLDDPSMFYAHEAQLGARYSQHATEFSLFAPTAETVDVVIYDKPLEQGGRSKSYPLERSNQGLFEGRVPGNWQGHLYRYKIKNPLAHEATEALDPYTQLRVGESDYGLIFDPADTHPVDWENRKLGPTLNCPVDMVVYELHVRDFSIHPDSGIQKKGKYLGFTEGQTSIPDKPSVSTGLDHLVELGITHVQLLPIQSFKREDESYNWGYMTVAFNSPEAWYASRAEDDSRISELKQLVAALHAKNIGVIMDVVYNHTDHSAPFSQINSAYYFRFFGPGQYSNGSGVGNDFRSEAPMVRKYMIDTLKYWVTEFGIDGFRFDLMALIDIDTMRAVERELRAIKPDIVLYGEPWSSGYSPIKGAPSDKPNLKGTGIAAFNDHFRNALGGSPNGNEPGFLQDGSQKDQLILGIAGSQDWADTPAQSINYITCHDNLVLFDKLRWFNPALNEAELRETMKLGYLILLTAQGVPLIHGGEEFARTKYGHGNSYCAGDLINQIDWNLKAENHELFCFVRDLIRIRKHHPLFRLRQKSEIQSRLKFHPTPTEKTILFTIEGGGLENETWAKVCVLVNGELQRLDFAIPEGCWHIALDHSGAVAEPSMVEHVWQIPGKSGAILFKEPAHPVSENPIEEPTLESEVVRQGKVKVKI